MQETSVVANRPVTIPVFIDVHDVIGSMKCSKSRAYEHMRAALCREPGERGQIRVPVYVWERYVREHFDPMTRVTGALPRGSRLEHDAAKTAGPLVRVTQPRTKRRDTHGTATDPPLQSPRVIETSGRVVKPE